MTDHKDLPWELRSSAAHIRTTSRGGMNYEAKLMEKAADALEEGGRVDLEQFRQAVACWNATLPPHSEGRKKAQDLFALINSQKDR